MKSKSRLISRANIINYIYKYELFNKKIDIKDAFENYDFTKQELKKIEVIIKNYCKYKNIINKLLSKRWTWARIAPLERSILIYGAFELLFLDKALVINELIDITKAYAPGSTYKYINGILENIANFYAKNKNN